MIPRGIVLLAHVDGRLERLETSFPMKLEFMQGLVQGYIEGVRMSQDILAIVNEESRLIGMPDNARYPNLCGPIVLCSDWVAPGKEREPDFGPLTVQQLRILEGGGVAPGWHTPYMDRAKTIPDEEQVIRIIDPNEGRPKGKG